MDSAPPLDLGLALEALHARSVRELDRLRGVTHPGTEAVGGWAQIGKCLDAVLRVTFALLCADLRRSADAEFRRLTGNEAWTIQRAMAGQLAYVLPMLARDAQPQGARVRAVIEAARDIRSTLRQAIDMRNAMVHTTAPPPVATLAALLEALRAWTAALLAQP